jgi:hypothetical protein
LKNNKWQLTPRDLAQAFAQGDPAGPSARQLLAAMFAVAPRDPDLPFPSNAEGVAELRRSAAAAAAVGSQENLAEMLDLATAEHDDSGQKPIDVAVGKVLSDFIGQGVDQAPPLRLASAEVGPPTRWLPLILLSIALLALVAETWRSIRVGTARLIRVVRNVRGDQVQVQVNALGLESVAAPIITETATKLSRRRAGPSRLVDEDRTIRSSVAQLGFLAPRFKPKSCPASYVFLLNRTARDDHTRHRFAGIVDALKRVDVNATRYDYSHDPRVLFRGDAWNWDHAVPLAQLYDRHPDARYILVSDGEELVNAANLKPFAWVRSILARETGLLTPTWCRGRPAAESLASNLGWLTEPATLSGLGRLADRLGPNSERLTAHSRGVPPNDDPPMPASISNARIRLLSDAAPYREGQETLVADLRRFLGRDGFYWLAATAIYPELRWDLTVFLGLRLSERGLPRGRPLFNDNTLMRLASLPWLRVGRFPEWMRRLLFDSISAKEQKQAQETLARMLEDARRSEVVWQRGQLIRPATSGGTPTPTAITLSIARQKSEGSLIPPDSVALELLTRGGRSDLLPPVTGRSLNEILGDTRRSLWRERGPILFPALAWVLTGLWYIPKPWGATETTGAWLPILALLSTATLALMAALLARTWRAVFGMITAARVPPISASTRRSP